MNTGHNNVGNHFQNLNKCMVKTRENVMVFKGMWCHRQGFETKSVGAESCTVYLRKRMSKQTTFSIYVFSLNSYKTSKSKDKFLLTYI